MKDIPDRYLLDFEQPLLHGDTNGDILWWALAQAESIRVGNARLAQTRELKKRMCNGDQ